MIRYFVDNEGAVRAAESDLVPSLWEPCICWYQNMLRRPMLRRPRMESEKGAGRGPWDACDALTVFNEQQIFGLVPQKHG